MIVDLDVAALRMAVPDAAVAGEEVPQNLMVAVVVIPIVSRIHDRAIRLVVVVLGIRAAMRSKVLMAGAVDRNRRETR